MPWVQKNIIYSSLGILISVSLQFSSSSCARLGPLHTHTRRRARDHYTSSTLIGGKSEAGPSSLHTRLEGPMECISECKMDVPVTHDEKHVQNWLPQHSLRSRETVCGPLRTHEDKISKWRLLRRSPFFGFVCSDLERSKFGSWWLSYSVREFGFVLSCMPWSEIERLRRRKWSPNLPLDLPPLPKSFSSSCNCSRSTKYFPIWGQWNVKISRNRATNWFVRDSSCGCGNFEACWHGCFQEQDLSRFCALWFGKWRLFVNSRQPWRLANHYLPETPVIATTS